ncbi:MAG: helix-turn-helix transcriptional regulator [Nostocoides sp.]
MPTSSARRGPSFGVDDSTPVFVISVAAELAGMHAQTLRQYDRLGLVTPSRTRGGGRRYSARDVELLREVQRLSQEEGVSLAGILRILDLENQVVALRARVAELTEETARAAAGLSRRHPVRFFAVSPTGDIVALRPGQRPGVIRSQSLVVWRPRV